MGRYMLDVSLCFYRTYYNLLTKLKNIETNYLNTYGKLTFNFKNMYTFRKVNI